MELTRWARLRSLIYHLFAVRAARLPVNPDSTPTPRP
jgi:hypothetical protein